MPEDGVALPFRVTNATTACPFHFIRPPDHCRFRHVRVRYQRALDFRGSEPMSGDIEHVVNPTDDPKITVLIMPAPSPVK